MIDAILVTELSRWGRSTQDLLDTLYRLAGWKVSVVAMSGMAFELDTPHGRMMATMLAGIAQFERDLLSERVKSGLAAARARGRKLGRQPGQRPKSDRLAPKGARCCRRREELPLDRPRPRHLQEHSRRYRQTPPRELLSVGFRPLPERAPTRTWFARRHPRSSRRCDHQLGAADSASGRGAAGHDRRSPNRTMCCSGWSGGLPPRLEAVPE